MGAKKKPQETLSLGDLGLRRRARRGGLAARRSSRSAIRRPRGDARKIEDDGRAAEQIVEFLAEKKLL